jgi:hypothetical protein
MQVDERHPDQIAAKPIGNRAPRSPSPVVRAGFSDAVRIAPGNPPSAATSARPKVGAVLDRDGG